MLREINKTLLQDLGLNVFPNLKYLSKHFVQIYRAHYGAAMLMYLQGTPTWRQEMVYTSGTYFGYLGHRLSELIRQTRNKHFALYLNF